MSRRAGEVFRVAAIAANSHPNSIDSVQIRFLSCYNESTNKKDLSRRCAIQITRASKIEEYFHRNNFKGDST